MGIPKTPKLPLTEEEGEILRNVDKLIECLRSRIGCGNLMIRPSEDILDRCSTRTSRGSLILTDEPKYGDPHYWIYPNPEIEAKIKEDRLYKVWYTRRDAQDPADSTTWNTVYYVEEISEFRNLLVYRLSSFLNEIS